MSARAPWSITGGDGPLLAAAIHDGHDLSREAKRWIILGEAERLREEDPYTSCWTAIGDTRIVVRRSRFEVDLNRPRSKALYRRPEDAWGLHVWKRALPERLTSMSLGVYDAFYRSLRGVLDQMTSRHGRIIVLDLHSYNHRRDEPSATASPAENPDINVGTGTVDRRRWGRLVDRFMHDVSRGTLRGRRLDVRENVRFQGGHLSQWVHASFPDTACALAIEVKKVFMDEWTGRVDPLAIVEIGRTLQGAVPGLRQELDAV